MTIFRINECLTESSNIKVVKNFVNEGIKKLVEVQDKKVGALGIIEGIFFVPDGISANNRFYSREFWEYVLNSDDVQNKLERKIMFGRIGHEDKEVTEDDINDGKISHIVTDLWIGEDGMGYGRATILDTPAGRNLYSIMSQGSDMRISSRASGDYKPNEFYQGTIPVMDETVYTLDTFDMVIYPGFIETSPKLKTSFKKESKLNKTRLQKIHEEFNKAKNAKVKENTMADDKLKKIAGVAAKKVADAKKKEKEATLKAEKLARRQKVYAETLKSCEKALDAYTKLGSIKKLKESMRTLRAFERLAETPEFLKEGLEKMQAKVTESADTKEYEEVLRKAESVLREYTKLGSIQQIKRTLEKAESVLNEYTKLGSIKQVKKAFEMLKKVKNEEMQKHISSKIREHSKRTGMKLENLRSIVNNSKDYQSAMEALESLPTKDRSSKLYTSEKAARIPKRMAAKTAKKQESTFYGEGSIAARLVENAFSKQKRLSNDNDNVLNENLILND